ncbi:MAG TPA: hypothetical protein VIN60_05570 [Anaerolineales bacterium]
MPLIVSDISSFLGVLLRALGFLVFGFAIGHFVFDNFKNSEWQLKIALALGLFGLLIGLTDFASAGSSGAFALGAGGAYFMSMMPVSKSKDEAPKN